MTSCMRHLYARVPRAPTQVAWSPLPVPLFPARRDGKNSQSRERGATLQRKGQMGEEVNLARYSIYAKHSPN